MKKYVVFSMVLGFLVGCKTVKDSKLETQTKEEQVTSVNGYVLNFKALGHEPEWNVQVTREQIIYKSINFKEPIVFTNVKANVIMDVAGIGYQATGSSGSSIFVQVIKDTCTDSMDGSIKPFRVNVSMNNGSEQALFGCGKFILDERLGKTWYMVSFKGNKIEAVNEDKRPLIKFDLNRNQLSANMGCNGIGGGYEVMENHIYFNPNFMSTQMFCEGAMELEKSFTEVLAGKTLVYDFKEGKLIFTNLEGVELAVFAEI